MRTRPVPTRLSPLLPVLLLVLLLVLLIGAGACAPPPHHDPDPLTVVPGGTSFLVLGDWGRRGIPPQRAVAREMGVAAAALRAAFVVTTGDNFYPDGVASPEDAHFRNSFSSVYTAPSLAVDWYPALGNHDYRQAPDAEVARSARDPHWRMPARYYSFSREISAGVRAEFFVLDSSPLNSADDEDGAVDLKGADTVAQRIWFDSALATSQAQWKFVVAHHHVYSGGPRGTNDHFAAFLVPRLKRFRVAALLSGHEHHLEHLVPDSIGPQYFISGAGSETRRASPTPWTRYVETEPGFLAVTLTADTALFQIVGADGNVHYRTTMRR